MENKYYFVSKQILRRENEIDLESYNDGRKTVQLLYFTSLHKLIYNQRCNLNQEILTSFVIHLIVGEKCLFIFVYYFMIQCDVPFIQILTNYKNKIASTKYNTPISYLNNGNYLQLLWFVGHI